MLLRTRIIAMVAIALALTAAGLGGAGLLREALLQQRLAQATQEVQRAQWQQALAQIARELNRWGEQLEQQDDFILAAERGDAAALQASVARLGLQFGPQEPLQTLAVLGAARAPLVLGQQAERPLLDLVSQERVTVGETLDGLRLLGAAQAQVLSARPMTGAGSSLVLVLARDVGSALQRFVEHSGDEATLLDLAGRTLASTDAPLWQEAAPAVALRAARLSELTLQGLVHTVSTLPVRDLAGREAGTLVRLAPRPEEARAGAFLGQLALGGTLALLLATLAGLNVYLRRRLRPLEQSVDALQALTRGDTSVPLPAAGDDEIGRIATAVARLRLSARELMSARALRERVRRRQEHLLRSRLEQLAAATGQPFTLQASATDEEQLRQLAAVMNQLSGQLIEQHRQLTDMVQELREALVSKTRLAGLQQELQIAAHVQLSILPTRPPNDARVQLDCRIVPAREVGGDFYDWFLLDADHLALVMADVSGKGVPAALFMTITRTLLKATAQFIAEPTECITRLNSLLVAENEQMMFVTLFYGVLDLRSGRLEYVNAGHNPPWLLRADTGVTPLARTGGMAVAIDDSLPYRSAAQMLRPGDQVFLFTDGVTEAFDPDGQAYGDTRLEQTLTRLLAEPSAGPRSIGAGVEADVHRFERGAEQSDDITCMALRYCGDRIEPLQEAATSSQSTLRPSSRR